MNEINLEALTTEKTSHYDNLDEKSVLEILEGINQEDQTVPQAVAKAIPQIEKLVTAHCAKNEARRTTILYWSRYKRKIGNCRCF